jgi:hypothetical protein
MIGSLRSGYQTEMGCDWRLMLSLVVFCEPDEGRSDRCRGKRCLSCCTFPGVLHAEITRRIWPW